MAGTRPILEQFEDFRTELSKSIEVKDAIRAVASILDDVTRQMQAALQPVYSGSTPLALQAVRDVRSHVAALQDSYSELRSIMKNRPGEYHRYHDHWRSQNCTVSFLLAFVYWLENGTLLPLRELESQLNLHSEEFGLDLEDYLAGLCTLSNELNTCLWI